MAAHRPRRLSLVVRTLILQYTAALYSTVKIQKVLANTHNVQTTRQSIRLFLKRYKKTGSVRDISISNKRSILNDFYKQMLNMWLSHNNELTSRVLTEKLFRLFGINVSIRLVAAVRKSLGWTTKRAKYCQLISKQNRIKRLEWCLSSLVIRDTFENVIFTDETTVELSSKGKLFFYKPGSDLQKIPAKRPKPKHSYKVHVWAGISYRGRTDLCCFTGIMDSITYQGILKNNFIPFVEKRFPDGYRLYQDNDSKHKSKSTIDWMKENGVYEHLMECPASSPDINVIELVWSTLKTYLETIVKPKKKDELVKGIQDFWELLTAERCAKFIEHIHRVLPYVVLNDGGPSGF